MKWAATTVLTLSCLLTACDEALVSYGRRTPPEAPREREPDRDGMTVATQPTTAPTPRPELPSFGDLLLDHPPVPVTDPRDGGRGEKPDPSMVHLDRTMILRRPATLSRDGDTGWWMLDFAASGDDSTPPDHRALPGSMLEQMIALRKETPEGTFVVTGETTVYHNVPYLLIRSAAMPVERPTPRTRPASPQPQTRPRTRPATAPSGDASSEDILEQLLKDKPVRPILTRTATAPATRPAVGPTLKPIVLERRRGLISDRLVRIIPEQDTGWQIAAFIGDNTLREPPLRILPSTALWFAEGKVSPANRFRVSGEVTQFRGRRYLFPRKIIHERDMGQFPE